MNNPAELFVKISKRVEDIGNLANIAQELSNNFKESSPESLKLANDLAYWLYIVNKNDLAYEVCNCLGQIEFRSDFNIWSWVSSALVLQSRILKERGDLDSANKCIEKIKKTFEVGDDLHKSVRLKALHRRLNGGLLYDDKIKEAEDDNDIELEIEYRLPQIKELIFIKEIGNIEIVNLKSIKDEISYNIQRVLRLANIK